MSGKISLEKLLDEFIPEMRTLLRPTYGKNGIFIPIYGEDDSDEPLALKDLSLDLWAPPDKLNYMHTGGSSEMSDIVETFKSLEKKGQLNIAYYLAHELKIASLAAALVLRKNPGKVLEIGCGCGFGAFHYLDIMNNPKLNPLGEEYDFTAIDLDERALSLAEQFREIFSEDEKPSYLEKIRFANEDVGDFLDSEYEEGDVVFSSMAVKNICLHILDYSNELNIPFVMSYAHQNNQEIKESRGGYIEELVDSKKYNVRPFLDARHNTKFPSEKRGGIIAIPKK